MRKKNFIGVKFYRVNDDNTFDIYRVIKKKGDHIYQVLTDEGKKKDIPEKVLLENFRSIMPHAYMAMAVCDVGTGSDACKDFVTIIGRHGENQDYALCRQNCYDPWFELTYAGRKHKLGTAVSRPTCPNNVNYDDIKMHAKFYKSYSLAVYLDDTMDSVLGIAEAAKRTGNKILAATKERFKGVEVEGLTGSLKGLWEDTLFWDLFDEMNRVNSIPGVIENNSLSVAQLFYLEDKLENHIINWAVIPYNYDINLNNIGMEYSLIRDADGLVYLITFQKGEKIENNSMSFDEVEKFTSVKR